MPRRTNVLFLCIGNACRSQIAEAVAKHRASDVIDASSAGLVPYGEVTAQTLAALGEHGISAEGQFSKPLRSDAIAAADLIVNMTGRAGAELFDGFVPPMEDWDIADPYGFNLAVYRSVRDEIEARVEELARRLRQARGTSASA